MKPAELGFLLGFFIFCSLLAPVQNGVARLTKSICHKYKDICNMDVEPGSCYEVQFRFFYNKTAKECQSFLFTGCDGNLNNFRLKIECDIECNYEYRTVRYTKPPTTTQLSTNEYRRAKPFIERKRRKSPLKARRSPRKLQESRRQQKPRRDPQTRHQMLTTAKKTRNRA